MNSLWIFEIKKLVKSKSTIGCILIGVFIILSCVYGLFIHSQLSGTSTSKYRGVASIEINKKIIDEHSGNISNKRIKEIAKDYVLTRENNKSIDFFDVFSWYVVDTFVKNKDVFYKEYHKKNFNFEKIKFRSIDELPLKIQKKDLILDNFISWNQLFQLLSIFFIVNSIVCIFICSPIFSQEKLIHIDSLLQTTKFGTTRLILSKYIASLLVSSTIYVFGLILILGIFNYYFGFDGGNGSVQLNLYWKLFNFPNKLNYFELLCILILFNYIGLIFTNSITILISKFTSSPFTTFAISLLAYFAPLLATKFINLKMFLLFPSVNSNIEGLLRNYSNNVSIIKNNFSLNMFVVGLVQMLVAMSALTMLYRLSNNFNSGVKK